LGLPSNTVIQGITDTTHAVLTQKGSGTGTVTITGGINDSDCVAAVNLCVVNGNEYRATPAQVNAEAWMSVINGANGIEWSCQDALSYSFCLGDSAAAGKAATVAQQNLTYVNQALTRRAGMLNAPTLGLCSMRSLNYLTGTAITTRLCTNGILSMRALNPDVPGSAMAKSWKEKTFLFAQPAGAGAGRFTFTMRGLPGRTATVVYDSNQHYDVANSGYNRHFTLDPLGSFTDTFGAHGDDYQVKIYSID